MADIQEKFDGRIERVSEESPSLEVPYLVTDASDEAEVISLAKQSIPKQKGSLTLVSFDVDQRLNESMWDVVAYYQKGPGSTVPDPVQTFDTTGGTQHITQSIENLGAFGPDASDELKGAIGYDGTSVNGVDVTVPVYNFTETHYFEEDDFGIEQRAQIFHMTGKINSKEFRGFAPGECKFMGASGSKNPTTKKWEVNYRFAGQSNRTDFKVGDIEIEEKRGWDLMTIQYKTAVDDTKKVLIPKATAVYIEKVYEEDDFNKLGIEIDE